MNEKTSAGGGLQRLAELVGLILGHLDDEPPTTFQRDPHDDAPPLLGDLQRTVACPRLHGRHVVSLRSLMSQTPGGTAVPACPRGLSPASTGTCLPAVRLVMNAPTDDFP